MKDLTAAYIAKEEAATRRPVEIYHIWRSGGVNYRYTSGDVTVTYDGNDYVPAPISRTQSKSDTKLNIPTINIMMALSDPALEYIATQPLEVYWVQVMKLHRDQDPYEANVIFIGQIASVGFKGNIATAKCVGFQHFLGQEVPIYRYSRTCNHELYSERCGVSKGDFKTTGTVTLADGGKVLISAAFGAFDDGYFTRGWIESGSEKRMITKHEGNNLTLNFPVKSIVAGDSVDAYPGCNLDIVTCRDKFSNQDNFLGFPYIPYKNPAKPT